MNNLITKFDQLTNDVSDYLNFYKLIYGNEIYIDLDYTQFVAQEVGADNLVSLSQIANNCQKCELSKSRKNVVFGTGNPDADIMLIGDSPEIDDDSKGVPFAGESGKLLTKILKAINLTRDELYITNILKCHIPENRTSVLDEQKLCNSFLLKQIDLIKPKFILVLGEKTGQFILNTTKSIKEIRGKVHDFHSAKLIITYHPAALLQHPEWKRVTWEDVQSLQKLYQKI